MQIIEGVAAQITTQARLNVFYLSINIGLMQVQNDMQLVSLQSQMEEYTMHSKNSATCSKTRQTSYYHYLVIFQ